MSTFKRSPLALVALSAVCALPLTGCRSGKRSKSARAQWVDSPSAGTKDGEVITISSLGVKFEIPDTLYVYRDCGEASHTPDASENNWIPIITCRSSSSGGGGFGGGDEEEDPFAEEEAAGDGAEPIDVTFYVTHKTRPLDERAVTWFENKFAQAGLYVDDISYQHDFQKKSGIYAKLHVVDRGTGTPSREIVQFLFPQDDVVFIARMEYPFGETRSVDADWKFILWNFDLTQAQN